MVKQPKETQKIPHEIGFEEGRMYTGLASNPESREVVPENTPAYNKIMRKRFCEKKLFQKFDKKEKETK